MNPWIALVACLIVTLTSCAGTALALVWALALRRRTHDQHLTVAAYRRTFGDALDTYANTNGEQP